MGCLLLKLIDEYMKVPYTSLYGFNVLLYKMFN